MSFFLLFTVEAKLKDMPHIDYFVFVLSSHGEERVEVLTGKDEVKKIEHYFFTNDGQYSTQTLMDKISDIEKLQGKLKMFVIQVNVFLRNRFCLIFWSPVFGFYN